MDIDVISMFKSSITHTDVASVAQVLNNWEIADIDKHMWSFNNIIIISYFMFYTFAILFDLQAYNYCPFKVLLIIKWTTILPRNFYNLWQIFYSIMARQMFTFVLHLWCKTDYITKLYHQLTMVSWWYSAVICFMGSMYTCAYTYTHIHTHTYIYITSLSVCVC